MKNELYSLIDKLVRWRMMPERPPINMDISLEDKARWNKFRSSCSFIMNTPVVKDKFINMGRSLDSETGKFYMSDKVLFGLQRVENSKTDL